MTAKVEYKINEEVANFMVDNYDWVINTSVESIEDFKPYDIIYTASTETREWVSTQEVKSIRGYPLKADGKFRDYFKKDIKHKMLFGNVPPLDKDLPKYWHATPTNIGIPKNIEDKPIYFLNATDINGCIYNSKWYHILQNNTGLTIAAEDGIVMFSPGQLKKAFITYAWYWQPSHTELYNKKYDPHWELKAIIDLSKGSYYKNIINKDLFKKY